jgi:hypothetical protein
MTLHSKPPVNERYGDFSTATRENAPNRDASGGAFIAVIVAIFSSFDRNRLRNGYINGVEPEQNVRIGGLGVCVAAEGLVPLSRA